MNMRHYLPKCIAITAVVVLTAISSCFGAVLSVPQYNQEQDQWCWNASSQMILAFKGSSYSQTEIADWAVGGRNVPNYLFNSPDSSRKGCDEVLSHFGNLTSSGSTSYISLSALATEMDNSRPVMIGVSWDSGGGHAIILRGTDGDYVYVNDPWPDNGQSVQTYDAVRRYLGQGTWDQTLQLSGGGENTYYEYYLYYYDLFQQYLSAYQSTGSNYYLAYAYYYYAYTNYCYYMYLGDSSSANAYYNYYMQYAQYYYQLYQYESLVLEYYNAGQEYYDYYASTGNILALSIAYYYWSYAYYYYYYGSGYTNYALGYYYYFQAYYGYYYYYYYGDSNSAYAWFNYYYNIAMYYFSS